MKKDRRVFEDTVYAWVAKRIGGTVFLLIEEETRLLLEPCGWGTRSASFYFNQFAPRCLCFHVTSSALVTFQLGGVRNAPASICSREDSLYSCFFKRQVEIDIL